MDRMQCRRFLSSTAPPVSYGGTRPLLAAYRVPRAYSGGRNAPAFYYYA